MDLAMSCAAAWQVSAASVRGKSHLDAGLPNQDSVCVVMDRSSEVLCAAVCDGAGTAARSQEGAEVTARAVAQRLCAAGERGRLTGLDAQQVRSEVEAAVLQVREHIVDVLEGKLADFHCTLVAWLALPGTSFVVQVGDSVAIATSFGETEDADGFALDFFPPGRWQLLEAERGEYSNETHFVTEADWLAHLRVTTLRTADAVLLMTDGAMDVTMLRGEVFRGFLSNLLPRLLQTPLREQRDAVIHEWLEAPQTHRVTGDDKTLFVAIRGDACVPEGARIFLSQRSETALARERRTVATALPALPAVPALPALAASRQIAIKARVSLGPAPAAQHLGQQRPGRHHHLVVTALVLVLATLLLLNERRPEPSVHSLAAPDVRRADRWAPLDADVAKAPAPVAPAEAMPPALVFAAPVALAPDDRASWVRLDASTALVRNEGRIRVTALTGSQFIEGIQPAPELRLQGGPGRCRVPQRLDAGRSCEVVVKLVAGTGARESYEVVLSFRRDGPRRVDRVVFDAPADRSKGERNAAVPRR